MFASRLQLHCSTSELTTSFQSLLPIFSGNISQQACSLSGKVLFVCPERLLENTSRSAHAVSATSVLQTVRRHCCHQFLDTAVHNTLTACWVFCYMLQTHVWAHAWTRLYAKSCSLWYGCPAIIIFMAMNGQTISLNQFKISISEKLLEVYNDDFPSEWNQLMPAAKAMNQV